MKKILIVIILVLAGAVAYFAIQKPAAEPIQNPPEQKLNIYRNGTYNFEFSYPDEFSFITPAAYGFLAEQIVQIQAEGEAQFSGTNLADYALSVSTEFDNSDCLKSVDNKSPLAQTAQINGVTFYKDTTSGAAAGNLYKSQIYRTVRDNSCYEISLTIHTGNIGNYKPGNVTEVDKNKVFDILDAIFSTFKFN